MTNSYFFLLKYYAPEIWSLQVQTYEYVKIGKNYSNFLLMRQDFLILKFF
jgi:hypothetical protein